MKKTLSVVISAYNEEKTLPRCLKSVSFADEIIVIDNSSSDATAAVAKKYNAIVYTRPNILMLNTNKNYGFTKAQGDWILNLDADEVIPEALAKEIISLLKKDVKENGFWIKRKNFSFGKWIQHGLWWPDKQLRLFKKDTGKFLCKHIHEYIEVEGASKELQEPYDHYNYETVHQYLTKIDRASSSEAIVLSEMNYELNWYDALRFPISDFVKIYLAQGGYKDGLHGLVMALFQAFYSFCTFAKYWEMQKFPAQEIDIETIEKELDDRYKEIQYWIATSAIAETGNFWTKTIKKLERKFI